MGKRTRKWSFVAQEATRLAALGQSPREIALRLGVDKSTVTRWMQAGKLTRPAVAPRSHPLVAQAGQTPAEWSAAVRKDYDLDATDEQLVALAEGALGLSLDASVAPHVRMNASGRFQAIVRQLSLVTRGAAAIAPPAPVSAATQPKRQNPRVSRPSGDPRTLLQAVK